MTATFTASNGSHLPLLEPVSRPHSPNSYRHGAEMSSTRTFPIVEVVPEDNMANGLTTKGSWVNGGPVSTPLQQRAPSPANSIRLIAPYTKSPSAIFEPKTKIELDSVPMQSTAIPQPLFTSEKNTVPLTHSPTLVSSIFPNELPARPPSRPSLISRVFHLSPQATRPPRSDKRGEHVFGTPDIEMSQHGAFAYGSRKDDKYRSIKLGLLLVSGTVLCMVLGMVVYLVVTYALDEHERMHVDAH